MKKIKTEELRTTIKVLLFYMNQADNFLFSEQKKESLKECISIVTSELERDDHSEVTIDMVHGREISLAEWAEKNGIDPSTARHKAINKKLKTARKIGKNWVINEFEENKDNRLKKNQPH